MSGLPGRSFRCKRYLNPCRCSSCRIFISGDVLLPRIPAIMRDLTSLLTMSIRASQLKLTRPEGISSELSGKLRAPVQIVDLFAGPGGLSEGFTSFGKGKDFEVVVSAEKDPKAWQTLRLRAFYRLLKRDKPEFLQEYYDFCNNPKIDTFTPSKFTERLWEDAGKEVKCITLGSEEGNKALDEALDNTLDMARPWVLIGGPPCQAYSVVGRARNQAKANYKAEDDPRHFLYKEYLRIIRERQPTIFVMENVKGIISAKVNNQRIFSSILKDLVDPGAALHSEGESKKYRIYSLVTGASFGPGDDVEKLDPRAFIIRSEEFGIPQARHRVILLGIAVDSLPDTTERVTLNACDKPVTVGQVLGDLPRLRSSLTKVTDSRESWSETVRGEATYLRDRIGLQDTKMWLGLGDVQFSQNSPQSPGGKRVERVQGDGCTGEAELDDWYRDDSLKYWLNHEVRGHMPTDLRRYLFASVYASIHGTSPKGHKGFSVEGLAPNHKNWETGKFSDRFRVQTRDKPATTITSHISKDGHYFIHYDPHQCRSLSVREAARIQTFPDNYFFQGNRTEQFHQVGNAVPPLLATKIAKVVFGIISEKVRKYDSRDQGAWHGSRATGKDVATLDETS